jgi:hypothetical protein
MEPRSPELNLDSARFFAHLREAPSVVTALADDLDDALTKTLALEGDLSTIAVVIVDRKAHVSLAKERASRIVDHKIDAGGRFTGAPGLWIQSYRRMPLAGIVTRHFDLARAHRLQRWEGKGPPVVAWFDGQFSYHVFPHAERRLAVERMVIERSVRPRVRPTLSKLASGPAVQQWLGWIDDLERAATGSVRRRVRNELALGRLLGHDLYREMRRSLLHALADGIPAAFAVARLQEQFEEHEVIAAQLIDHLRAMGFDLHAPGSGNVDIAPVLPLRGERTIRREAE